MDGLEWKTLLKMDDLGVPLFSETSIYSHQFHQRSTLSEREGDLDDPRGEEIWMKRHRPCEGHLVGAGGNSYRKSSWLQHGGPTYWHSYSHI